MTTLSLITKDNSELYDRKLIVNLNFNWNEWNPATCLIFL